jgi:hypothetical protein
VRSYSLVHSFHICVVNLSAAPFPNAIRSTACVLDLLSGSNRADPECGSLDDACAEHIIAVPSSQTVHAASQEDKTRSVQLLKDKIFDSKQFTSQCYKHKRLVAYYNMCGHLQWCNV